MPRISREPIVGLAHCSQQVDDHGELAFDFDGSPMGVDRCPGYRQTEVAAIRETVAWTYGEFGAGGSGDPMDQALANNISHSHSRVVWANVEDRPCPYCGSDREVTDQVRPVYTPLGGPRGNADQLFADRRQRREQGQAVMKSADASERQAAALEEANRLKARELEIRERELENQQARAPIPATHRRKPAARVEA